MLFRSEREMQQMIKQAEQIKQEEQKMLEAKRVRAHAMIVEVEEANKRAIEVKD